MNDKKDIETHKELFGKLAKQRALDELERFKKMASVQNDEGFGIDKGIKIQIDDETVEPEETIDAIKRLRIIDRTYENKDTVKTQCGLVLCDLLLKLGYHRVVREYRSIVAPK